MKAARCRLKRHFSRAAPSHLLGPQQASVPRTITVANLGMANGRPPLTRRTNSRAPLIGVPEPGTRSFRWTSASANLTGTWQSMKPTRPRGESDLLLFLQQTKRHCSVMLDALVMRAHRHSRASTHRRSRPAHANDGRAIVIVDTVGRPAVIGSVACAALLSPRVLVEHQSSRTSTPPT
jgi:hypothetical protein